MQEHTAEEELRKLQMLAGALRSANEPSTGAHMSNQELSERMDALSEQLDDFEKRFASADPEVKQILAHLISNPSAAEELALASDTPTITQHQTPNSSDSAQTQSATDSAQQRWGFSSPSPDGDLGALHGSPQRPTLSPARRMGDIESSPMFPAITPSNSLAQQVTSRESLSDCAASFPTTLPSTVRSVYTHTSTRH